MQEWTMRSFRNGSAGVSGWADAENFSAGWYQCPQREQIRFLGFFLCMLLNEYENRPNPRLGKQGYALQTPAQKWPSDEIMIISQQREWEVWKWSSWHYFRWTKANWEDEERGSSLSWLFTKTAILWGCVCGSTYEGPACQCQRWSAQGQGK